MNLRSALTVAAAVVLAAAVAAIGFYTVVLLQGTAVLLELIARSLEATS